jgi:sugar lactone lactonase YvrE
LNFRRRLAPFAVAFAVESLTLNYMEQRRPEPKARQSADISATVGRRNFCRGAIGFGLAALVGGCSQSTPGEDHADLVWGRIGISDGRFQKPRAITIDANDNLYIVDMTARIQVFDADGNFQRVWSTPTHVNGRPTGMSMSHDGLLMVADTHYYRVLFYTPEGKLRDDLTIGGTMGQGPGEFGFVTDIAQDSAGNYYVSEYGEFDRIQRFSPNREYVLEWGGHGTEPGKFARPQSMAVTKDDRLVVSDACNHRIQIFDTSGKLLTMWGEQGSQPGQLSYPYGLALDPEEHLYVCEYGNHRVQKMTLEGKPIATWGHEGRRPGQIFNPWSLVLDSRGRVHVLDSMNHRVQRFTI